MAVTLVSTRPAGTFHVVPPPPPRPQQWSEKVIAIVLALLLNILLIAPFLLPNPAPRFAEEPPSIAVDLITEEQAAPPPPPELAQPEPEEQTPEPYVFSRSGDDSGMPKLIEESEPAEEARPTDSVEETSEPDTQTTELKEKNTEEDVPGWASTVTPGFDLRSGNPDASTLQKRAAPSVGGGDIYLNKLSASVHANVDSNEVGGLRGKAVFDLIIHRSGAIVGAKLVKSSGYVTLDRAFAAAIQRSIKQEPFPASAREEYISVTLNLSAGLQR